MDHKLVIELFVLPFVIIFHTGERQHAVSGNPLDEKAIGGHI